MPLSPGQVSPVSAYSAEGSLPNLVDQDVSTFDRVKHDANTWVDLDLGGLKNIHKITIYYFFYSDWWPDVAKKEWCFYRKSNWNSCSNAYNNTLVSVFANGTSQKSCGTLQISKGFTQKDHIYTFSCHAKGDTVRLHKSTGGILLAEIIVDTKRKGK